MEMNILGQSQENNITPRTNVTRDVVDFCDNDPTNPLNWPKRWKWSIVILTACLSAEL